MWKARLPYLLFGAIFVFIIYQFASIRPEDAAMKNVEPAPDFSLNTKKGEPPITKESLKGKVIILDFWATWCGPCRMSIPELAAVYDKFRDQGLEVIGISMDDNSTRAQVPAAAKEFGINYPMVYALDTPEIVQAYPAGSIPTMYIIDKSGKIRRHIVGYGSGANLEQIVAELVKE
jgi:cytochrome c biogenesis protein CcmG, thiol:disulfide interchange protein DsbE